jgi:EVE domain-containing protein
MSFWIFKCDPKRYRLSARLADPNPAITWLVTRYKKVIASGDTAFLMEVGPRRAIRAVMRVDAGPCEMAEVDSEQAYWVERDTETRCRVQGTITLRIDLPITELEGVEGLEALSILHGVQRGTNFRVTDSEGEVLLSLVEPGAMPTALRGHGSSNALNA